MSASPTRSGRFSETPQARRLAEAQGAADEAASYVERKMGHRIRRLKAVLAGEPIRDDDRTGRYVILGDPTTR